MKRMLSLFLALITYSISASAQDFNLLGYQEASGAITNNYNGNTVEPYFATKALLIMLDVDQSARPQALSWVAWALKMQDANGLFGRYTREGYGDWHSYLRADADDSMFALWLELLYRLSPDEGMPVTWKNSAEIAEKQLASLYEPVQGIYYLSSETHVGLFMDNIEVYSAFKRIEQEQRRLGNTAAAEAYATKAEKLRINILTVFRYDASREFLVSTQIKNGNQFYPDKVAQIFPTLYSMPSDKPAKKGRYATWIADKVAQIFPALHSKPSGERTEKESYNIWIANNGKEWLTQGKEDYPWGLIAVAAINEGDIYTVKCWKNHAEPMRYGKHWNVLEEVVLQYADRQIALHPESKAVACAGGNLS